VASKFFTLLSDMKYFTENREAQKNKDLEKGSREIFRILIESCYIDHEDSM